MMRKIIAAALVVALCVLPVQAQINVIPGGITQLTSDCAAGPGAGSQAVICTKSNGAQFGNLVVSARSVNLGALGDAATITIPSNVTKYQVASVQITNCSTTPILAQPALYTAAAGGGTNLVAATTITAASSAPVVINSVLITTNTQTAATLYVRVAVANAAALTCDFFLSIKDLT